MTPRHRLGLSLLCGSLSSAGLLAALLWGWGVLAVVLAADGLLVAVLHALFWFAETTDPPVT